MVFAVLLLAKIHVTNTSTKMGNEPCEPERSELYNAEKNLYITEQCTCINHIYVGAVCRPKGDICLKLPKPLTNVSNMVNININTHYIYRIHLFIIDILFENRHYPQCKHC